MIYVVCVLLGGIVGFLVHDRACWLYECAWAMWLGRNLSKAEDPLDIIMIKRMTAMQDIFNEDSRTYTVVKLRHQAQGLIDDLDSFK